MQRTRRGLEIQEIVEAFNAIIEIICECYNHPLRERFETAAPRSEEMSPSLFLKERYWKDIRTLDGGLRGFCLIRASLRLVE